MSARVYHTMTSIEEQTELLEFVKKAGECLANNPELSTYGSLEPGSLLGIRWGMGDRHVKVVRLDADFQSLVFEGAALKVPS